MVSHQFCELLVASLVFSTVLTNDLARGWGDTIDWQDLPTGLEQARTSDKPLMLLIHKSWCGACKNLKPKFEASAEIAKLSERFVMVNTLDDEEPKDAKYAPDGGYIPRIFFLNPNGEVVTDIINEGGSEEYKYFYHAPDPIVASMKKVIAGRGMKDVKQDL